MWINVKDYLPETNHGEVYLDGVGLYQYSRRCILLIKGCPDYEAFGKLVYSKSKGKYWCIEGRNGDWSDMVSAWMAIPEQNNNEVEIPYNSVTLPVSEYEEMKKKANLFDKLTFVYADNPNVNLYHKGHLYTPWLYVKEYTRESYNEALDKHLNKE